MTESTAHREAACKNMSPLGRKFFSLIEFDDNEELVEEIRKHPVGLLIIEITGTLITGILVAIMLLLAIYADNLNLLEGNTLSSFRAVFYALAVVLGVFGVIGTVISSLLYRSNVIFVTDEKIAQVLYRNILDRKISQLSIGDVQDVTVTQTGLFSRLFRYGTLVIETAGEQQNYTFTYVPNPYESAKAIVNAHEENLKKYGN